MNDTGYNFPHESEQYDMSVVGSNAARETETENGTQLESTFCDMKGVGINSISHILINVTENDISHEYKLLDILLGSNVFTGTKIEEVKNSVQHEFTLDGVTSVGPDVVKHINVTEKKFSTSI